MISPIFTYIAILVLLKIRTVPRLALAAIACAFASFFTQQRGVLTAAAIVFTLLIEFGLSRGEWSKFLRLSLIFASVCVAALALMLLPFVLIVGTERFFDDTFLFLISYAQDPATNSLQTYVSTILKIRGFGNLMTIVTLFYTLLIPAVYIVTLIILFFRRDRQRAPEHLRLVLVCLVGLFLAVGTTGPNVYRLFQVSMPALVALVWLIKGTHILRPILAIVLAGSLAAFGLVLGVRLQTAWDAKMLDTASGRLAFTSPVIRERYEWLLAKAEPGDKVFEVYNSHVNFPLGLRNPSRMSILLNTGYSPPEHVAWAIEDLKRENPRYIIWDGAWTAEMSQLAEGERLKPLYVYLTTNYRRVHSFTPYDDREREIWERIEGPQPAR